MPETRPDYRWRLSPKLRLAAIKACVVLIPCYAMAFLTGQMVYVVPTLAASAFFAAALEDSDLVRQRVDDSSEDAEGDDQGADMDSETTATDTYQDVAGDAPDG